MKPSLWGLPLQAGRREVFAGNVDLAPKNQCVAGLSLIARSNYCFVKPRTAVPSQNLSCGTPKLCAGVLAKNETQSVVSGKRNGSLTEHDVQYIAKQLRKAEQGSPSFQSKGSSERKVSIMSLAHVAPSMEQVDGTIRVLLVIVI